MTHRHLFAPLVLRATGLSWGRSGMALGEAASFQVAAGQCLLLRGLNGTGKTTLLLTLAGMVAPLGGSVLVEGSDGDERTVHYCGHRNAVKARLSVRENLQFWAEVNGPTGMASEAALEEVGLAHLRDLDAGYLSAGQGRRLALARLLVSHRPLWLLDEPTAALDTEGHALVERLIDRHLDGGGLMVIATHDPITSADPARIKTLVLGAPP